MCGSVSRLCVGRSVGYVSVGQQVMGGWVSGLAWVSQYVYGPDLLRVGPVGQDVQQVSGGDEVEAGEGQALGVQVLSQSLLTQGQPAPQHMLIYQRASVCVCACVCV